jgi:serine/threonine protein phosphatase PrpC
MDNDEIYDLVKRDMNLDEIAVHLVNKANENGGRDNISVILIKRQL